MSVVVFFSGGGGEEGGLPGLEGLKQSPPPQKPTNFKWLDLHSELSVGCFYIQWQVRFTANLAIESSLFSFVGGRGRERGSGGLKWSQKPKNFRWPLDAL